MKRDNEESVKKSKGMEFIYYVLYEGSSVIVEIVSDLGYLHNQKRSHWKDLHYERALICSRKKYIIYTILLSLFRSIIFTRLPT